jgi:hypothetical protein
VKTKTELHFFGENFTIIHTAKLQFTPMQLPLAWQTDCTKCSNQAAQVATPHPNGTLGQSKCV